MSLQVTKLRLTVEQYHQMGEAGILREKGIELINGEIIEMSPIGSRHAKVVKLLNKILNKLAGEDAIISIQDPIITGEFSEPEPDVAILKYRPDFYESGHPKGEDVLLVIEVADTSLEYDRTIKLPLYAESGIPEYWIINLEKEEIEAYWHPVENTYKFRELLRPGDKLQARMIDLTIPLVDILG